ncbi:hypothetical protein FKM82_012792 [Ascaphus truei]
MSPSNIKESSPEAFSKSWKVTNCPDPPQTSCINMDNGKYCSRKISYIFHILLLHFQLDFSNHVMWDSRHLIFVPATYWEHRQKWI